MGVRRLVVANGPNIFQMFLVLDIDEPPASPDEPPAMIQVEDRHRPQLPEAAAPIHCVATDDAGRETPASAAVCGHRHAVAEGHCRHVERDRSDADRAAQTT